MLRQRLCLLQPSLIPVGALAHRNTWGMRALEEGGSCVDRFFISLRHSHSSRMARFPGTEIPHWRARGSCVRRVSDRERNGEPWCVGQLSYTGHGYSWPWQLWPEYWRCPGWRVSPGSPTCCSSCFFWHIWSAFLLVGDRADCLSVALPGHALMRLPSLDPVESSASHCHSPLGRLTGLGHALGGLGFSLQTPV